MDNEFLTLEEVQFLTGRDKPSLQVRWLEDHGWKFLTNMKGLPIVGRMYCRQKMSVDTVPDDSPNFGAVL